MDFPATPAQISKKQEGLSQESEERHEVCGVKSGEEGRPKGGEREGKYEI